MSVAKVVEHVGSSEKRQYNTWNSGDRSKAKQEFAIKLTFGIERNY
jgi:hypothetical protein